MGAQSYYGPPSKPLEHHVNMVLIILRVALMTYIGMIPRGLRGTCDAKIPVPLRNLCFHFLSHWMGYDRGDSFPFDFEPKGFPLGSKSKGKLLSWSYPMQCERNLKHSFISVRGTSDAKIAVLGTMAEHRDRRFKTAVNCGTQSWLGFRFRGTKRAVPSRLQSFIDPLLGEVSIRNKSKLNNCQNRARIFRRETTSPSKKYWFRLG